MPVRYFINATDSSTAWYLVCHRHSRLRHEILCFPFMTVTIINYSSLAEADKRESIMQSLSLSVIDLPCCIVTRTRYFKSQTPHDVLRDSSDDALFVSDQRDAEALPSNPFSLPQKTEMCLLSGRDRREFILPIGDLVARRMTCMQL